MAYRYNDFMTIVHMNATGRVTIPAGLRQELGVEGEGDFAVEVENGTVVLRPVVVLMREDAWAYTPEHRTLLRQAHADSRKGRVRELSEEDLAQLGDQ
jgi:bifunctional DNA-binding transcriptional regulator/antitoxin component of YhaV-PrlF toxin-antitoxin module